MSCTLPKNNVRQRKVAYPTMRDNYRRYNDCQLLYIYLLAQFA